MVLLASANERLERLVNPKVNDLCVNKQWLTHGCHTLILSGISKFVPLSHQLAGQRELTASCGSGQRILKDNQRHPGRVTVTEPSFHAEPKLR